jgi:iron complex outermembrane receptor protein
VAGNSPEFQAAVYSYLQLSRGTSVYAGVRYVDELPNQDVPSYVAVDTNLDWRMTPRLTATLTVRNLNDGEHPEYGAGKEIERSALVKLDWAF